MPRVENSDRIYPFLWQVHLPQGESMVLATPNLCPEYRWSWSSFGLARKNAWKQKSLEDWVGTHHETEMEAMTADIVFSGVGDSVGLWIMTLPRFALWLPVGVIFLLGFACWNRFPICRSPVALVGVAVVLALLVPIATDLAMLLTQWVAFASLLGVVITVAKWAIDYRVQKRSVFSNRQISRSRTTGLESSGRSVASPIAQGTESLSPPSGAEVR